MGRTFAVNIKCSKRRKDVFNLYPHCWHFSRGCKALHPIIGFVCFSSCPFHVKTNYALYV